jgi:geranylgeranyl diphosphate synthase type II
MEDDLKKFVLFLEQEIQKLDLPKSPENLYDPLRYFLKLGGKRIRPILTLLGADLFGEKYENALSSALAIEYFHNFSLIHDDIMDEAPLRRTQETVHTKWNSNIAILSGDVLLIKAYQEICKQKAEHLLELMSVFNKTAIEVCEGQQLDMDFETRKSISVEEYIEMIRLKTSVLLGCALEFGAIIAEANTEDKVALYNFGQNIGIAFQIQDDVLDLYAESAQFGKQIGGDIISNKKTLLILKAYELANPFQKEFLLNITQIEDSALKIEQTKTIFAELGVKEAVLKIRDSYFEKGLTALNEIQVSKEKKSTLIKLVDYLKSREV